jgi:hypothetical protein
VRRLLLSGTTEAIEPAEFPRTVEFDGYVKQTQLRYRVDKQIGKETTAPELLVFVNTHPDKPLRLDRHYLQNRTHQGKIPHQGQHVSAPAVELDSIFILKGSAVSIEDGDEYRRRRWVPAAIMVKTQLRDTLADMLLTVAVQNGRDGGWKTSTQFIYERAKPLVPGNPKTKMKKTGPVTRWLFQNQMIKPLVYDKGVLKTRHFAKGQIWELEEKYRTMSLEEVLAARQEFSRLEAEEEARKDARKASEQVTLDEQTDNEEDEESSDPNNYEM